MDRERKRALQHAPFRQVLSDGDMKRVKACLPFSLTEDQEAAVGDILAKMAEGYPMNHLLLGDVGTGKTVVAAFALVCAALSGHQAMLMGPTEVLVSQYGISLGPILCLCLSYDNRESACFSKAVILKEIRHSGFYTYCEIGRASCRERV